MLLAGAYISESDSASPGAMCWWRATRILLGWRLRCPQRSLAHAAVVGLAGAAIPFRRIVASTRESSPTGGKDSPLAQDRGGGGRRSLERSYRNAEPLRPAAWTLLGFRWPASMRYLGASALASLCFSLEPGWSSLGLRIAANERPCADDPRRPGGRIRGHAHLRRAACGDGRQVAPFGRNPRNGRTGSGASGRIRCLDGASRRAPDRAAAACPKAAPAGGGDRADRSRGRDGLTAASRRRSSATIPVSSTDRGMGSKELGGSDDPTGTMRTIPHRRAKAPANRVAAGGNGPRFPPAVGAIRLGCRAASAFGKDITEPRRHPSASVVFTGHAPIATSRDPFPKKDRQKASSLSRPGAFALGRSRRAQKVRRTSHVLSKLWRHPCPQQSGDEIVVCRRFDRGHPSAFPKLCARATTRQRIMGAERQRLRRRRHGPLSCSPVGAGGELDAPLVYSAESEKVPTGTCAPASCRRAREEPCRNRCRGGATQAAWTDQREYRSACDGAGGGDLTEPAPGPYEQRVVESGGAASD